MRYFYLYCFILVGGVLQAMGAPMNGQLRVSLTNAWLATLVSFVVTTAFFVGVYAALPYPVPAQEGLRTMPWWAPFGGLVGAAAVVAGLLFVDRIGAGAYSGLTITANILMSLAIDNFGWFQLPVHTLNFWRALGGLMMVAGVYLVSRF